MGPIIPVRFRWTTAAQNESSAGTCSIEWMFSTDLPTFADVLDPFLALREE
jgi:hypothetical protein